jgi:hypothetical protein
MKTVTAMLMRNTLTIIMANLAIDDGEVWFIVLRFVSITCSI